MGATLLSAPEVAIVCCAPLGAPVLDDGKLFEVGLVDREQRGKWVYYSLRRDAVEKLAVVADLKGVCC